jgi:hypothetical protein
LEPQAGNAEKESASMHAHQLTSIATALALVAAPAAFGAGAPRGSHGQETDARTARQIRIGCDGIAEAALVAHGAAFAVPRGSHGQEFDHVVPQLTLRLACSSRAERARPARSAAVFQALVKGSHGQETDRLAPHA